MTRIEITCYRQNKCKTCSSNVGAYNRVTADESKIADTEIITFAYPMCLEVSNILEEGRLDVREVVNSCQ